ncbi:MAG: KEOPS complex subunit Pcc1 [Euryarchaeota archaeon]|nr:KEOPS complex subunit Pcc1 [Euryarchaeota archaeon]
MDTAEFQFDFGSDAPAIYRALLPEAAASFPRSQVAISLERGILHLSVAADGVAALRAVLNTWLRLIRVAHEMVGICETCGRLGDG